MQTMFVFFVNHSSSSQIKNAFKMSQVASSMKTVTKLSAPPAEEQQHCPEPAAQE